MDRETDLTILIANMQPTRDDREFVFCRTDKEGLKKLRTLPLCLFCEKEAITLILERDLADVLDLPYEGVWGLITLNVYSDLSAVGLLAAVTTKLASSKISVNAVSAFHHDHLLVPLEKLSDALKLLEELRKQWKSMIYAPRAPSLGMF